MDPSQRAAEPTEPIAASTLLKRIKPDGAEAIDDGSSEDAEFNRRQAAAEMANIFALKDSPAFEWFFVEFVDKPYRAAFAKLRDPFTPADKLLNVQTTYLALREVRTSLLQREIAHRRQMNQNDEEIPRLEQKLAGL